jgi:hypothetical protein
MSTYIINSEPELAAVADADEMLVYDASSGVTNKVGVDVLRQYMGGGLVSITAADSITPAEHANRTLVFNVAAGVTVTLPAATGTGDVYKFVVGVTVTSVADVIQVANATDEFVGTMYQTDTDTTDTLASYPALDGDGFDTITMDGSTKGGIQGDSITITDIASGKFLVEGFTNGSGTVASPWSAAVS